MTDDQLEIKLLKEQLEESQLEANREIKYLKDQIECLKNSLERR